MVQVEKLSAQFCERVTDPGRYNDGRGLYLLVKPAGSKSWVFRFRDRVTGKRHDMGLGPYGPRDVTLADAREKAADARELLRRTPPVNPIEHRQEKIQAAKLEHASRRTFKECADAYIEANRAGWKNPKHAAQWPATLDTYAGDLQPLPVADIDTPHVLKCLEPIWAEKTETATRVRQRIEAVLDWATARGYRAGENPARWRGHLDKLLPKPTKLKKVRHRPALPYAEAGDFMAKLRDVDSQAARAVELAVLTATRPGESFGARWSEFDLEARVWTIPGERMKADREHEIPLSKPAVALLRDLPRVGEFVFPGRRLTQPATTAGGMKLVKELRPGITVHGFRSTFRDWAADRTAYAREVIEHALAHRLKDKAEAAYARSTIMPKRKRLMADWAAYLAQPAQPADVTPIQGRAAK